MDVLVLVREAGVKSCSLSSVGSPEVVWRGRAATYRLEVVSDDALNCEGELGGWVPVTNLKGLVTRSSSSDMMAICSARDLRSCEWSMGCCEERVDGCGSRGEVRGAARDEVQFGPGAKTLELRGLRLPTSV
jgi:hypothetical protein